MNGETPDFRTRRVSGEWAVDAWSARYGWEELPGRWPTRGAALAATRPLPQSFCNTHWSWLCSANCAPGANPKTSATK